MQVILTAVGPDNRGLADPIVHHVTSAGASIAEIQMYDHDRERLFAMVLRMHWPAERVPVAELRERMQFIGRSKALAIRVWSAEESPERPRLAVCVTNRKEPLRAVLQACREGRLSAEVAVVIGNRAGCRPVADEFAIPFHNIGNDAGAPDDGLLLDLLDRHAIDYIALARYMRMIPPTICWQFGGGRILNLHPGLLPPTPGGDPYRDAYLRRMLVFGATVHFVSPELGLAGQIIHQDTFTIRPGMPLDDVVQVGRRQHEPDCLVEGVRRVVDREVELRFHKVVAGPGRKT